MKEFSEKELEEAYKNVKMMEVPDMWEEIERNLAPKKTAGTESRKALEPEQAASRKKKRTNVWKYTSAAAAAIVLLLILPVSYILNLTVGGRMDGSKSDSVRQESADLAASEENIMDTAKGAGEAGAEGGREEAPTAGAEGGREEAGAENGMKEAGAEENGMEDAGGVEEESKMDMAGEADGGNLMDGNGEAAAAPESTEQSTLGGNQQGSKKVQEVQLEVQVQEVRDSAEGLRVTAEVVKEGGGYKAGEKVEFLYEGTQYPEREIQGNLKVRLQKEENILKLLEILP